MSERLILKGRLLDCKKRYKDIELKADAYISIIREIIDPYGGHFTEFDIDKFMVISGDFHKLWLEARDLKEQIARLEKALNG